MAKTRRQAAETRPLQVIHELEVLNLEVPLVIPSENGYQSEFTPMWQAHLTSLTKDENWGWHVLYGGLTRGGYSLDDGTLVKTKNDALRWVLQRLSDAIPHKL